MVLVGLSWLLFWLLVDVFNIESLKAALVTAIVFILIGLLYDYSGDLRLRRQ